MDWNVSDILYGQRESDFGSLVRSWLREIHDPLGSFLRCFRVHDGEINERAVARYAEDLTYVILQTSLSSRYYQIFLAQGVAGGLAGACVFAPCVALASISFDERRSLAVGLATSGFIFGAVIYPIVFRELQSKIGFAWTTRVMASMAFGCFMVAYPLLYWKTPRTKRDMRKIFDVEAWKDPAYATFCWAVFFVYAG